MAASRDPGTTMRSFENDQFRQEFKYYKRKQPPPDLKDVIDFANTSDSKVEPYSEVSIPAMKGIAGLRPVEEWKVLTYKNIPDLIFIVNPFLDGWQRYWVRQCLEVYPCKPNLTNLDAHMTLSPHDNIWHQSVQERKGTKSFEKTLVHKLRWVTLGYHHNWETKEYSLKDSTPMPADMKVLAQYVAASLGWLAYQPEAAIVNYYHQGSTLSGHTDHSELDHQSPLLSVSFGRTAIFLLGGPTKSTKPVAMYLRSGDIVLMHGTARLAYHGIPRILTSQADQQTPQPVPWAKTPDTLVSEHSLKTEVLKSCEKTATLSMSKSVEEVNQAMQMILTNLEFDPFTDYLLMSRINMNIRQVVPQGKRFEDFDRLKRIGSTLAAESEC